MQKHMLRVAAFDLGQGKDKYCTGYGPVPSRLPFISMSTRFHDKTVETADNPVYNSVHSRPPLAPMAHIF